MRKAQPMDRFMTTEELAEVLRTTPAGVRYLRASGRGPKATKIGRRVLYSERDVDAWLRAQNARDSVPA